MGKKKKKSKKRKDLYEIFTEAHLKPQVEVDPNDPLHSDFFHRAEEMLNYDGEMERVPAFYMIRDFEQETFYSKPVTNHWEKHPDKIADLPPVEELKRGQEVMHRLHGVCVVKGCVPKSFGGKVEDYLAIIKRRVTIYIPVRRLHEDIKLYVGAEKKKQN